jgi:hypothetical protein
MPWSSASWMQPREPVPGVQVRHRIHRKIWRIETESGAVVVELNWQTGNMVASIDERRHDDDSALDSFRGDDDRHPG